MARTKQTQKKTTKGSKKGPVLFDKNIEKHKNKQKVSALFADTPSFGGCAQRTTFSLFREAEFHL